MKNKKIMRMMQKPHLQALNMMLEMLKITDLRDVFKSINVVSL